ncbi:MAG: glycosyltransferase family 8 protein [Xanthobacteraceae bacterium]|nr:glycosyltransferase family 8 protein [Xanthobacteraceae bacterium]
MTIAGMHIVSSTDDGYFEHFCGFLHSAWLYNPGANFYLLDTGISPGNLNALAAYAQARHIKLSIVSAGEQIANALPNYRKRYAFGRIFIPELLPHLTRAIYMDCDMTVTGGLTDLFETDLKSRPAAVCLDSIQMTIDNETRIQGIDYKGAYFNSGMMVMDLSRWRKEGIAQKVLSFARKNPDKLPYMDQSAINVVLRGRVKILDKKWNFFNLDDVDQIDISDIRVVHHTNNERPWKSALNPFRELYRLHRNQTPWPFGAELKLPLSERFKRKRREILAFFGSEEYRPKAHLYKVYDAVYEKIAVPSQQRAEQLIAGYAKAEAAGGS